MNRQTKLLLSTSCLLLCAAIIYWWSRPGYKEMSTDGYQITLALYSACNAKSLERIAQIESIVDNQVQQQQLNQREAEWFQQVVHRAREGDWHAAAQQSRQILSAQVVEKP